MKFRLTFFCVLFFALQASATRLFIPMDAKTQTNHLKAYGIAYSAMQQGIKVQWLLNYKGGSFVMELSKERRQSDGCSVRWPVPASPKNSMPAL